MTKLVTITDEKMIKYHGMTFREYYKKVTGHEMTPHNDVNKLLYNLSHYHKQKADSLGMSASEYRRYCDVEYTMRHLSPAERKLSRPERRRLQKKREKEREKGR